MRSCNTLNTQQRPLIRQVQPEVKRQRKKQPGRAASAGKSRPGLRLITRGLYLKTGPAPRWLLMFQHRRRRYRKVIGDAGVISQAKAETMARDIIRAVRSGKQDRPILPPEKTFRTAGEMLLKAYSRHWKPVTHDASHRCFRDYLLPWFGDDAIEAISRPDVLAWFDSMRDRPGAANRTLPLLSVLMEQAEYYGLRPEGSNPCKGIRQYRLNRRERFLTTDEMHRLGEALCRYQAVKPAEVAMIRLLVLTGCRKGEMLNLQWSSYCEGHLYLSDSKTGPKTIFLSTPARDVLDQLPRRNRWVFPHPDRRCQPMVDIFLWYTIREEIGLNDVRLHDLRHSYASAAIRQGVDLQTLGQLLGHVDPCTTLQYVHLCDDSMFSAVETLGRALLPDGE